MPKPPKKPETPADVLKMARDLIADRTHWCVHNYATDASGRDVPPTYPDAHRFCALGACRWAAQDEPSNEPFHEAVSVLASVADEQGHGFSVATLNDVLGHAAVLRMFDGALLLLDPTYVPPPVVVDTQTDVPQPQSPQEVKADDADPNGDPVPF